MIQRKQTLFLLGVVIAILACLFFPVASVEPEGMGEAAYLFNLGVKDANGVVSYATLPLFAIISLSGIVALASIFLYKNRKLQMRFCTWAVAMQVLWYAYYALLLFRLIGLSVPAGSMRVSFAACLPLVSIILLLMARKGISDDERLVRAADRVR